MFLLTDPTLISINHIQQAQKQADSGFNDVIAQLYQDAKEDAEKAEKERIKQAKEKALEEQRRVEEKIKQDNERKRQEAEAINKAREREREKSAISNNSNAQDTDNSKAGVQTPETTKQVNSSVIGNDWSQVSPEQASQYMSAKTGVPVGTWLRIVYAESTNNPTVTNSIGCFGYLQLHPIHGNVSGMTPQQYLDTAVSVYNSQGLSAWEVTTNGMVN